MDEKDLSQKIKDLDFSRFSDNHKERLWKALNERSSRRVLQEHELDINAAGIPEMQAIKLIIKGEIDHGE